MKQHNKNCYCKFVCVHFFLQIPACRVKVVYINVGISSLVDPLLAYTYSCGYTSANQPTNQPTFTTGTTARMDAALLEFAAYFL